MKRLTRLLAIPLSATLWLAGCAALPVADSDAPAAPRQAETPMRLQERQIIVALSLVAPAVLSAFAMRLGRYYDLNPIMGFPLPSVGVHCLVFEVPQERSIEALLDEISALPGVELAQRNRLFRTRTKGRGDPYASLQHGAELVGASDVHPFATGRGVRVAVVDTGVDADHPDLRPRIAEERDFVRDRQTDPSGNAHGTAVAGIIAAGVDDGVGIYGIAPDVELMVARACWEPPGLGGPSGVQGLCSSWSIALALDHAIESGAQVVNFSLTGVPDELLARLLVAAHDDGIVVVAAADGSDAARFGFPASHAQVIAVTQSDEPLPGVADPNRETPLLLAAPGSEILTTAPDATYKFLTGSSMSTAHVTGAVALLLELDGTLSPGAIAELLGASAKRPSEEPGPSVGVLDVCAAARALTAGNACPL